MKIIVTEQQLNRIIESTLMESVEDMIQKGTDQYFARQSETAMNLKKIKNHFGWGVIGYKHDGSDFKFYLSQKKKRAVGVEEMVEQMGDLVHEIKDCSVVGNNTIVVVFDTATNIDYKKSQEYAKSKYEDNARWETPWGITEPYEPDEGAI